MLNFFQNLDRVYQAGITIALFAYIIYLLVIISEKALELEKQQKKSQQKK
jgi:hypothetical protein